jgi:hypothetical protein
VAHDVFISYSSTDKVTADAVCAALESRGIRCWIAPRDVLPGEEYAAALVRAVHESRLMVLVFSSRANQSPQVLREVERAVSQSIPIIPFRVENVAPTAAMEYYISTCHWLDALTVPLERHLETLASTAAQLLNRTASRPVASPVPVAAAALVTPRRSTWPRLAAVAGAFVVVVALVVYFFANRTTTPAAAETPPPSASQPVRAATSDAARGSSSHDTRDTAPSTPAQTQAPDATSSAPGLSRSSTTSVTTVQSRDSLQTESPRVPARNTQATAGSAVVKSRAGATNSPECTRLLERVSLGEADLLTAAEKAALAQCGR